MNVSEENKVSTLNLPPEILGRIFVICHGLWQTSQMTSGWNPRLAPLRLASVCRYWRQAALATSELWSTCWLCYEYPEMNSLWMSRASTRMLTVEGWYHPLGGKQKLVPANQILPSIIPYSHYFKSFGIDFRRLAPHDPGTVDDDHKFDVPNLTSCCFQGDYRPTPQWAQTFLLAPKLRLLEVLAITEELAFVLPSLAHLKVQSVPNTKELLRILASSHKLDTLQVQGLLHTFSGRLSPNAHSSLAHLELHFFDGYAMRETFDLLTLPHLKTLAMSGGHMMMDGDPTSFIQFLDRSQCAIERLRARLSFCRSFITVLQHPALCSLKSLEYSWMVLDGSTIRFLSNTSNFPHLRELSFDGVLLDSFDLSLVGDMVIARRAPIDGDEAQKRSKLKFLEFTLDEEWEHPTQGYYAELQRLKIIAESTKGEPDAFVVEPKSLGSP